MNEGHEKEKGWIHTSKNRIGLFCNFVICAAERAPFEFAVTDSP